METDKLPEKKVESGEEEVKGPVSLKEGQYIFAIGRRKTAVARVRLYRGQGKITINDQDFTQYLPTLSLQHIITAPLSTINQEKDFDFTIKVSGGGIRGQAEAIRHGLSRALSLYDGNFRLPLKKAGFLKRDPREKERKKYGLKKARRAPQWQKR